MSSMSAPGAGMAEGAKILAETFSNIRAEKRQREKDAQAKKLFDLQFEAATMDLNEKKQKAADALTLRSLREAAATTPVSNPQRLPSDMTPEYAGKLSDFLKQESPNQPVTTGEYTGPTAGQPATVIPNEWRIQINAAKAAAAKGLPEGTKMLQDAVTAVTAHTKALLDIGDDAGAIKFFSEATGEPVKYLGTKDNLIHFTDPQGGGFVDRAKYRQTGDLAGAITRTGGPKSDWEDLGEQRVGRNTVLVQINRTTGEKKYTKLSPDVVVNDGKDNRFTAGQLERLQGKMRDDKIISAAKDSTKLVEQVKQANKTGLETGNYVGTDQVIGYYVNKILDPNSVVMPSEFQRIASTQGLGSQITGNLRSIAEGGIKLTPENRRALIRTIEEVDKEIQARSIGRVTEYEQDAISLGLDPKKVMGTRQNKISSSSKLNIGDVKKGYKYIGGDPSKPASWKKVGGN